MTAFAPPINQRRALGGSFYSTSSVANGSTQIVAAAANVNGLIVRRVQQATGANSQVVCAGALAPTSLVSNAIIAGLILASSFITSSDEIEIPAGQGLWTWANAAGGACIIDYDLK